MKRIVCLCLAIIVASASIAQTADEVINKFIGASGGREKLEGIKTLQYSQVIKFQSPMGAIDIPMELYKEKDKLYRVQTSMQLGPQTLDFLTVVTDTAGYILLPANPMTGSEGGLQKMEEKDRKNNLYQMDVQGLFGALVNYNAKGNKVELLKDDKVNKEDCFKIKLTTSEGQEVIFFINKTSNLIVRQDAKGTMAASLSGIGGLMSGMGAGGRIDKMEVSILYNDYKDVDGIKFPTKWVIKTAMGDNDSELSNIKINQPIEAKMYKTAL